MSAVLFVVTIPTEKEEKRLKIGLNSKLLDLRSDEIDTPVIASRSTGDTETFHTTTAASVASKNSDVITETEAMTPTTPLNAGVEYGTFPKSKTSEELSAQGKTSMDSMTITSDASVAAGSKQRDRKKEIPMNDKVDGTKGIRKSLEGLRDIMSSASSRLQKTHAESLDLNMPDDTCLEIVLREILKLFQISNAVWTKDLDSRKYQILFTIEYDAIYEKILEKFHEWGIGDRSGSTVSVMNCIISKSHTQAEDLETAGRQQNAELLSAQKQSAWHRFMNSVRSRLNVTQIVRDVRQDASITFDFLVLLVSAAILASFGLVENSVVFLASSMLISPLMGPIIAAVFGTVIKDRSLCYLGLKNELFGILLATLVGFVFGVIVACTDERYGVGEGLTTEMLSRCELHSLIVGIFTAIPSGAAGAIGILGGNVGSLVGVAISASILPPAVNSGLLWALACIYKFFEADSSRYNSVIKSHVFSQDQFTELALLGVMSMCVTITNVIFVYLMGVAVLKVKEIAPVIARKNQNFWKHDIKIARDLNKNNFNCDADAAVIEELAHLPQEDQKALGIDYNMLRNLRLDETIYQSTWSPFGNRISNLNHDAARDNYLTVHNLGRLYKTITNQHPIDFEGRRPSLRGQRGMHRQTSKSSYELLAEKIPRSSTMPISKHQKQPPSITITSYTAIPSLMDECFSEESTPTSTLNQMSRRQFIVTPAQDPLHERNSGTSSDGAGI